MRSNNKLFCIFSSSRCKNMKNIKIKRNLIIRKRRDISKQYKFNLVKYWTRKKSSNVRWRKEGQEKFPKTYSSPFVPLFRKIDMSRMDQKEKKYISTLRFPYKWKLIDTCIYLWHACIWDIGRSRQKLLNFIGYFKIYANPKCT